MTCACLWSWRNLAPGFNGNKGRLTNDKELRLARELRTLTFVLLVSKAGRGLGKLNSGEKKKGRLWICPAWRLLAWGRYTGGLTGNQALRDWYTLIRGTYLAFFGWP